jgi:hypothetical protein
MKRLTVLSTFASLALLACDNPVDVPAGQAANVRLPAFLASSMENTLTGDPQFGQDAVFPSTNLINFNKTPTKWAHVLFVDDAVGEVTLNFVSERMFFSCFEFRIDDAPPVTPAANPNPGITDGLWPFTCRNNNSLQMTFAAQDHVDVRMGFGAESDERFNWTRFYVLGPTNKDQCKDGGWEALGFKNQGQCVRFVETGKDSRTGG